MEEAEGTGGSVPDDSKRKGCYSLSCRRLKQRFSFYLLDVEAGVKLLKSEDQGIKGYINLACA